MCRFDDWLNGRVVFENIEDIDNLTIPLLKEARADYQKASSDRRGHYEEC